jgi:ribosomal protein S12 methylthiotransferase
VTEENTASKTGRLKGKAAVVTLGCARNQVDSEVLLGFLREAGFELTTETDQAEVIVVNTCGFIEAAVKESIDCILELIERKPSGQDQRIIVAGCLVSRYGDKLKESLPEVSAFLKTGDLPEIVGLAAGKQSDLLLEGDCTSNYIYDENTPRILSTPQSTAFVKISEGCDHACSFCTIPKIRGKLRSRTIDSILCEVAHLGAAGIKEVNLVAEDLTSYGAGWDSGVQTGRGHLVDLLAAIDASAAVDWVRLLYTYPTGITTTLLSSVANLPTVCEYLDLPLQHSSEKILRSMRRPLGRCTPRRLIDEIKSNYPEIHIRTTFIVGYPGENDQDLMDLEDFIRQGYFSGVGVFVYSPEEGSSAFDLASDIDLQEKEARRECLMLAQQEVNTRNLSRQIGQVLDVLIEGMHPESDLLLSGRTRFQAPEVDGGVIINDSDVRDLQADCAGIVKVEITDVAGYDLIGTLRSPRGL